MRIALFGDPEVLAIIDLPDPIPGDGQRGYATSSSVSCVNHAGIHVPESRH